MASYHVQRNVDELKPSLSPSARRRSWPLPRSTERGRIEANMALFRAYITANVTTFNGTWTN